MTNNQHTFIYQEPNGGQLHLLNGELHRTDGPAVIRDDHQEWYSNGKLNNPNGPARLFKKTLIAEWWFNAVFQYSSVLPEATFMTYWKK